MSGSSLSIPGPLGRPSGRYRAPWQTAVHPLRSLAAAACSRALDAGGAAVGLALLSPLLVLHALYIYGRTGKVFDRTVVVGRFREPFTRVRFASPGLLREVPALLNVLRGNMSLVGPRPMTAGEAHDVDVRHGARWDVRPGLVSLHAVRERARVAHVPEADTDCEFVYMQSPLGDAGLLARALPSSILPAAAPDTVEELSFFGVSIANTTMDEAVTWIVEKADGEAAASVAFVNPDCLNIAYRDPSYREILTTTTRVLPDGIGLNVACRMVGTSLRANINGTDLFPRLCTAAATAGRSLYLLGGRPGIADAAATAMTARYPSLRIAGTHDGFVADAGHDALVEAINASGASVLLVGLGAPRQERWIAKHAGALRVPVRIGVGGLFDYYSGRIPRAPVWMRESGLEWVWRLAQEPGRLWRRYLIGNPLFLYRVWRESRRQPENEQLRDDIFRRLAGDGPISRLRRRRWQVKCQLWTFVVSGAKAIKRTIDIIGGLVLLVALMPVFLAVAVAVRLDSPGPILFPQIRVGRWGRPFRMMKFRSMYVDAEARKAALMAKNEMAGGVIFKMKHDPRITRVGRIIRKASIDELPQLWNVVNGDMSLVGPRPPVPNEVARYTPEDRRRLEGVPGITCLWQVSGRSDIPFPEQVRLDVRYLESQSVWLDITLLIKTIPAVLLGRGAY